ncbi:MAG: hypothetical protein II820_05565 [Ruminiclostridium sp.]|nr:hypothetical protein [Ruminiclostridium sp.]
MNENKAALPYTELTAGDRTYLLRLTALSAARLEERLGMSVYKAAERMDEIKIVSEFVYALIEGLRPEFTRNEAYTVIDDFISAGGTLAQLNGYIAAALEISGFFGQASTAQGS